MFPDALYPTLSRYNRWMNEKLLAVCAELSDEERKRDLNAPFRSIHGTWNHLLLADRIWLGRFNNSPFEFKTLADELYPDFAQLQHQRALTDDAIDDFVVGLTPEKLNAAFHFTSFDATRHQVKLWICLQHLFNHQTHHRGQITVLLEQLNMDCGVTDFTKMPHLPAE